METVSLAIIALGLTQLAKGSGFPKEWAPLLSLVLGMLLVASQATSLEPKLLIDGLVVGLTASGTYSQAKKALGK